MDQRDGRIRHNRRKVGEQFVAEIGTRLGEITKQSHQKQQERKKCEQEIVRELCGASKDVVLTYAGP